MAKIVSPAGDFEVRIEGLRSGPDGIVLQGEIGIWDAEVHISVSEVADILGLMVRPSFLRFAAAFPFLYFKRRLGRSRSSGDKATTTRS